MDKLVKATKASATKAASTKSSASKKPALSSYVKIELVKSVIGRHPKHVSIVKQLGLGKMRSVSMQPDNPAIRGLINQVCYLVRVEEVAS